MSSHSSHSTAALTRRATLRRIARSVSGAFIARALLAISTPANARAGEWCQCVGFLKQAGKIEGGPCWAKDYRGAGGYERSRQPQPGWVMVIQPGILGVPASVDGYWLTNDMYCDGSRGAGHVALVSRVITAATDANPQWTIRVRHANWASTDLFSAHGCDNVSVATFTIPRSYLAKGWVTFIRRKS